MQMRRESVALVIRSGTSWRVAGEYTKLLGDAGLSWSYIFERSYIGTGL